jgi:hypothetical protein
MRIHVFRTGQLGYGLYIPSAQTARDKDGVPGLLSYFLGRDSGGTRPERR